MSAVSKKKSDKKDKIILNIQRTLCYIVLIIISILCLFSFYVLLINTTRSHPDIQKGFSLIPGKSFFVNLTASAVKGNVQQPSGRFRFGSAFRIFFGTDGICNPRI